MSQQIDPRRTENMATVLRHCVCVCGTVCGTLTQIGAAFESRPRLTRHRRLAPHAETVHTETGAETQTHPRVRQGPYKLSTSTTDQP